MAFRATAKWIDDFRFEAWDGDGRHMKMDASEVAGGQGDGFRPAELPLIGLLGCTGIDTIEILKKMRQPVEGLELSVESGKAEGKPPTGYDGIRIAYSFTGEGLDAKKVEQAVRLSEEKYCTVGTALSAGTTITHTITINGEKL
ncbi:MAG: OsmC family peroxiredoxin [Candidatus Eisenbacteria bacterium]|nr:OsmC family peroxiredoxin [Candidatus Eisenbacteria bacterium]